HVSVCWLYLPPAPAHILAALSFPFDAHPASGTMSATASVIVTITFLFILLLLVPTTLLENGERGQLVVSQIPGAPCRRGTNRPPLVSLSSTALGVAVATRVRPSCDGSRSTQVVHGP